MERQTASRSSSNNNERSPLGSIGNRSSRGDNANRASARPKRSAAVSSRPSRDDSTVSSHDSRDENEKPKILCLGMSTPNVSAYVQDASTITVEQVIELVQTGRLSQIDGRDFARSRATEIRHNVDVYTVSMEDGHVMQEERHVYANFNRQGFVSNVLCKAFDNPVFYQVIIDYFWCPDSWKKDHWKKSLFRITLPKLVELGMVSGAVYLPFSLYCVKQVISAIDILSHYYDIGFVEKRNLGEHLLWSGTATINADEMQGVLGKKISQEDIYCTFTASDVLGGMDYDEASNEDVLQVLSGIENFGDVRMIRLTPLAKYNPLNHETAETSKHDQTGGFVGLLPHKKVKRGL